MGRASGTRPASYGRAAEQPKKSDVAFPIVHSYTAESAGLDDIVLARRNLQEGSEE